MTISDRLSGKIDDVVCEAVDMGITPQEFIRCVQTSWIQRMEDQAVSANKVFADCLATKRA